LFVEDFNDILFGLYLFTTYLSQYQVLSYIYNSNILLMADKKDRFEITELFMYKAGQNWHRRFMGTIKRMVGADGRHFVCGQVDVNECTIYAKAPDEEQLVIQLDEIILMILDNNSLHNDAGKTIKICNTDFFLN
jgi:hypothetical protein